MAVQIQFRRDTAANWASVNPTLAQGELGLETDTGKLKMGTGTVAWNSLSYYTAGNVNAVTASTPLSSSGGANPNLTIQKADNSNSGYLSSIDWQTFNNKQPALGYTAENTANKGAANGYASLDSTSRIPLSQMPLSVLEYNGTWNASTNTPTLSNSSGISGQFYIVSVGGSVNFGAGAITFNAGDWCLYNGTIWEQATQENVVTSVGGNIGAVTGTQLTASLNAFTSSLQGAVPSSGGGTTNFLRADGAWANPSTLTTPISIANGGTNNSSAYTAGSIPFSNGTKLTQDNSNLFWDSTNFRLGIQTTTPNAAVEIHGKASGWALEVFGGGVGYTGNSGGLFLPGNDNTNNPALAVGNASASNYRAEFFGTGDCWLAIGAGKVAVGNTNPSDLFSVGSTSQFQVSSAGKVKMDATAAGSTGAQTINKPTGSVQFAAAATSLVVTNSLVTSTSIIYAVLQTNDATAVLGAVVPASGSFTIYMKTAPTATSVVGFVVFN